uniref:Putative tick metalloprotease 1 n=1 Tax=Amblyomma parvum TaxID=251391 RepID=A0A023FXK3_AMBPA
MKTQQFIYHACTLFLLLRCISAGLARYQATVYPQLFDGRKDDGTKVLKVNGDITLNLKPSSFLPEDFFVRTYDKGVAQYKYFDVEDLQKDLYHDERALAAVTLSEEDGRLQVEGVIGPNLKIKPVEGAERAEDGLHPHLIETIEDPGSVYGKAFDNELSKISSRAGGFDPAAYDVQVIYPEVFVICDSKFQAGFKSEKQLLAYLLRVFKVVNIRYRTVTHPKVKIVFRGVELTKRTAETYYKFVTADEIDGYKSLQDIVKYVKSNNDSYGLFDLVYFTTGYDMVAIQGSDKLTALSGYAFVASACTSHREQLGEDTPMSYKMIRIMAHEMAHTLGCPHDGSAIEGIVKAFKPDVTGCPWDDGYIMSYKEEDSRSMKFSSCCTYMIAQMSWSYEAECLRRNDTITKIPERKNPVRLPGELLSKTKQCKMAYPELRKTYFMPEYGTGNCMAECFVPGEQFAASDGHWSIFLLDGTPCDNTGKRCFNGDCRPVRGNFLTPIEKTRPPVTTTEAYYR